MKKMNYSDLSHRRQERMAGFSSNLLGLTPYSAASPEKKVKKSKKKKRIIPDFCTVYSKLETNLNYKIPQCYITDLLID
jgi:hypothetical protein